MENFMLEEEPFIFTDSLVFLHERFVFDSSAIVHLEKCIKKEKSNSLDLFLQAIASKEHEIVVHKQQLLQVEAEMKRLQLEITTQSLSHSEKDKQASLSYDSHSDSSSDKYLDSVREKYKNGLLNEKTSGDNSNMFLNHREGDFPKKQESLIDVDKPHSLTPPPLPRKPVALMQCNA